MSAASKKRRAARRASLQRKRPADVRLVRVGQQVRLVKADNADVRTTVEHSRKIGL